jgi:hypothetical protein
VAKSDAGPTVTKVRSVDSNGNYAIVTADMVLEGKIAYFIVSFSEAVSQALVQNVNNWSLSLDGKTLANSIVGVVYDTNANHAILILDGDSTLAGNQTLVGGRYVLTVKDNVTDLVGTKLDGNHDGAAGGDYTIGFNIKADMTTAVNSAGNASDIQVTSDQTGLTDTGFTGTASSPEVACDAAGNYVVVWEAASGIIGDNGDVMVRRYNSAGIALGDAFSVVVHPKKSTEPSVDPKDNYTGNDFQTDGVVAMNASGDFVVVWAGAGTGDAQGIFAQVFDRNGNAYGGIIRINNQVLGYQSAPSVAMDAAGNFIVTWTSNGPGADKSYGGIYGRRFNVVGKALTGDFLVNTTTIRRQDVSDVAMNATGSFVVVWQSDGQDGSMAGVYGQLFNAAGKKVGGEFRANAYTRDKQITPAVAIDSLGRFVVTWASYGQDNAGYGVYARRYGANAAPLSGEFLVNQTRANWQVTPDVAMASDGRFVVTWASCGQDNLSVDNPTSDWGIYGRVYYANGANYVNAATGAAVGEFRINNITRGDQVLPSVAMSTNGRIVTAWTGPYTSDPPVDTGATSIFSRIVALGYERAVSSVTTPPVIANVGVSLPYNMILWNADDVDGVGTAILRIDGKVIAVGKAAANVFYGNITSLAYGNHNYTITMIDSVGNASSLSGSFVKTAPPKIVSLAITGKNIAVKATAGSGIADCLIRIDGNLVAVTKTATGYTANTGALKAGNHTCTVAVFDNVGRVVRSTKTFAASSARSAVFGRSAVSSSAKVEWLYDVAAVATSQSADTKKKNSANAVDAIFASY